MIDWNRITELRGEVGADAFDDVLDLFLSEVDAEIDQLRSDPRREDIAERLHFLKGSALNLGLTSFSDACQRGEAKAAQNSRAECDIAGLIACYETSKSEMLGTLKRVTAA